ncbi:DNA-binding MarR family transcriptional regulator [Chitinophaga skermanii]|uniref:DNA-binding MarR family transcriptional regulator n=1 Tax=Chitinophaga skermanii TaxID=331697 RepID=A0A327PZI5_9BACT|nr:MarR family transcriptional regulator [Chitinophaga skermanii]RAI97548.1 DNA-binding MarR family transcriptional regulator [Chitinophaga skermanii]
MNFNKQNELDKFVELIDIIQGIRTAMRKHLRHKIKQHHFDITFEMLEVMIELWKRDKINQQELADILRRNKATLTSLIDNLSARHLVERLPDPRDRRINLVALTQPGIDYRAQIMPLMHDFYETFMADFSMTQLEIMTTDLGKLYMNIQANTATT